MTITLIILYQRQKKYENRSYKINLGANYNVLFVFLLYELLGITDMSSGIVKVAIKDHTNCKQN